MALYIIYELIKMGGLYIWQQKTKKENAAVAETKETAKKATVKKTREVYLQWYGKEVQLNSITATHWGNVEERDEEKDFRVGWLKRYM